MLLNADATLPPSVTQRAICTARLGASETPQQAPYRRSGPCPPPPPWSGEHCVRAVYLQMPAYLALIASLPRTLVLLT